MTDKGRFQFLICDLDETLYPAGSGLMRAIGQRMRRYMIERVGIPTPDADRLKRRYYRQYGTTMRGLILHHGIVPEDYLDFVHDLPLEQHIQPNPGLDPMLAAIPLRKAIFTNANREHARRVLDVLGVRHHFEWIIDVSDSGFDNKPNPGVYRRLLEILNAPAEACIMVEDAAHNLVPAKAMGMLTVLVGDGAHLDQPSQDGADVQIRDILHLARALRPWLAMDE